MRALSAFFLSGGLVAVVASSCVCGVTPDVPPDLRPAAVGTIVGTVYIEDPTRASVDGATIQVYGSSARTLSQLDKQFVLK